MSAAEAFEVIAVVGATGTGKSMLADALACTLQGEVISADSMQVYRGMDIGTAKVPPSKRSVPYHCLDLVEPDLAFTAALYQRAARTAIEDILKRQRLPIVCGGTGLYVRAALDDFFLDEQREFSLSAEKEDSLSVVQLDPCPSSTTPLDPYPTPTTPLDPCPTPTTPLDPYPTPTTPLDPYPTSTTPLDPHALLRTQLFEQAKTIGNKAFHDILAARDPLSAALIHPNNVRRVVRAFELLEEGTTYAAQHEGFLEYRAFYSTRYLGIKVAPAVLYEAIDRRVDELIATGLLDEVRLLVAQGYRDAPGFSQAIGYKELLGVLDGTDELDCAVDRIKQATRRYAKRQRTWFKRDARIRWIEATDLHEALLARALESDEFARQLLARALDMLL